MRPFEYARPQTEAEAVDLLSDHDGRTAVLAGGTDLMTLLRRDAVQVERVVDIKHISSMQGISQADDGVLVGSLTTLEDAAESPLLAEHHSVLQVAEAHKAIQIQQAGTLVGDLCQLPHCWYFRNGYGLLGMDNGQSMAEAGDNRYHAIFGNSGPAKFVSGSRFAPSMIAWGAKVRVVGPEGEEFIPLEYFFATPKTDRQNVTILKPGQLVTHVWLPSRTADVVSGAYEVLELNGLDRPQAAAAVTLKMQSGVVQDARIVMGHVAPTPWVAQEAANALVGQSVNEDTASRVGDIAVAGATPLSMNGFKVQMARAAVKRSLLRAVGQLEEALV